MKLLKLLENIVHEQYRGVDIKMFALFADIFSDLIKGLKMGMLDEVYQDLSQRYEGTKKQLPLEYFYDFLIKNIDYFSKEEESLQENEKQKDLLFKYWDNKGVESTPIYHYLGLDSSNNEDKEKILTYKIEYFGGIYNVYEKIKKELKVGKPFSYTQAGYEIEGIISEVTMDIYTGQTNHPNTSEYNTYYDVMVTINGDNSSVTLMNDGKTYMIGDLWDNNDNVPESVKGVVEEIGYEIGDVLRDYVDSITHSYGLDSDSIDYNVVTQDDFNITQRKVD
tara:strand:+ start:302 stop:1138 length:837 start_codon:yes stop_codon:yes gene_type:complete